MTKAELLKRLEYVPDDTIIYVYNNMEYDGTWLDIAFVDVLKDSHGNVVSVHLDYE